MIAQPVPPKLSNLALFYCPNWTAGGYFTARREGSFPILVYTDVHTICGLLIGNSELSYNVHPVLFQSLQNNYSQLSHAGNWSKFQTNYIKSTPQQNTMQVVQVNINTHPRAAGKLPEGNLSMKRFVQTEILLTDQIRQANNLQENATFAKSWPASKLFVDRETSPESKRRRRTEGYKSSVGPVRAVGVLRG